MVKALFWRPIPGVLSMEKGGEPPRDWRQSVRNEMSSIAVRSTSTGFPSPCRAAGGGALSPQADRDVEEFDDNGARVMTRKFVKQLLRSSSGCYVTPQYNTSLYLNSLGFGCIQGLEDYTGCKVLHLESNCLRNIQGLSHMRQLRALYLQSNDISKLEGLQGCTQLEHLDISSNPIHGLTGLPQSLSTLHASGIGLESDEVILELARMCPDLQVLDLSRNRLPGSAIPALCMLAKLRVLYTKDNPCTKSPNYRRLLISSLPHLSYLDDQPIDELDRCGAEAWVLGGRAAEAAARLSWREERRRALKRTTATFAVERAQRRVLRELTGILQSDEQLSRLMGMLEGTLQPGSVSDLVARMLGESRNMTVPPEALGALQTGLYHQPVAVRGVAATWPAAGSASAEAVEDSCAPVMKEEMIGSAADTADEAGTSAYAADVDGVNCGEGGEAAQASGRQVDDPVWRAGNGDLEDRGGGTAARAAGRAVDDTALSNDTAGLQGPGRVDHGEASEPVSDGEGRTNNSNGVLAMCMEECVVCSEELAEGAQAMWLPCTHVFHERCIRQWLTGFSNTCPTCRAVVIPAASTATSPTQATAATAATTAAAAADADAGFDVIHKATVALSDSDGLPTQRNLAACDLGPGEASGLALLSLDANAVPTANAPAAADAVCLSQSAASSVGGGGGGGGGIISTHRIVSSILAEVCAALAVPLVSPAPGAGGWALGMTAQHPVPPAAEPAGRHHGSGGWGCGGDGPQSIRDGLLSAATSPGCLDSQEERRDMADSLSAANATATTAISSQYVAITASVSVSADQEVAMLGLNQGCSSANTLQDPTYCHLQHMYRQNFGQKSKAAESVLAGWQAMKETRRQCAESRDINRTASDHLITSVSLQQQPNGKQQGGQQQQLGGEVQQVCLDCLDLSLTVRDGLCQGGRGTLTRPVSSEAGPTSAALTQVRSSVATSASSQQRIGSGSGPIPLDPESVFLKSSSIALVEPSSPPASPGPAVPSWTRSTALALSSSVSSSETPGHPCSKAERASTPTLTSSTASWTGGTPAFLPTSPPSIPGRSSSKDPAVLNSNTGGRWQPILCGSSGVQDVLQAVSLVMRERRGGSISTGAPQAGVGASNTVARVSQIPVAAASSQLNAPRQRQEGTVGPGRGDLLKYLGRSGARRLPLDGGLKLTSLSLAGLSEPEEDLWGLPGVQPAGLPYL